MSSGSYSVLVLSGSSRARLPLDFGSVLARFTQQDEDLVVILTGCSHPEPHASDCIGGVDRCVDREARRRDRPTVFQPV